MTRSLFQELAHDLSKLVCRGNDLSDALQIAANLVSLEREKNIDGLNRLSQKLGKDVTTPVMETFLILQLTVQALRKLQQHSDLPEVRSRGIASFLEAVMVDIFQKIVE